MRRAISNLETPPASRRATFGQSGRPIACLRIPNFPWQVEVARRPELQDRSAIVAGRAIDLSEELVNSDDTALSARVVLAASPDLADDMPLEELKERLDQIKQRRSQLEDYL